MTTRAAWLAVAFLALVTPVLVFPGILGYANMLVAATVGMVALGVAVGLIHNTGRLAWPLALLSLAAIFGWWRVPDNVNTLNHFCGLALGVLAMSTLAVWCRNRLTFAAATGACLLLGAVVLGVGLRSTTPLHETQSQVGNPLSDPRTSVPLPLQELHARRSVNPNALGPTAMLILPIAAAVAIAPVPWHGLPLALRLLGWMSAALSAVVVLLTQSRSVWLSAMCLLVLLTRRWIQARTWWRLVAASGVLVAVAVVIARDHPVVIATATAVGARADIWRDGVNAWRSSPWFGIGLDYLRESGLAMVRIAPDRMAGAPHAHNMFLQTALDVGLCGLVAYLAIIGFVLRRAADLVTAPGVETLARYVGVGAGLSVVSVHVYGLFDAVPLGAKVGLFQWLSCGLILAASRMRTPPEET